MTFVSLPPNGGLPNGGEYPPQEISSQSLSYRSPHVLSNVGFCPLRGVCYWPIGPYLLGKIGLYLSCAFGAVVILIPDKTILLPADYLSTVPRSHCSGRFRSSADVWLDTTVSLLACSGHWTNAPSRLLAERISFRIDRCVLRCCAHLVHRTGSPFREALCPPCGYSIPQTQAFVNSIFKSFYKNT